MPEQPTRRNFLLSLAGGLIAAPVAVKAYTEADLASAKKGHILNTTTATNNSYKIIFARVQTQAVNYPDYLEIAFHNERFPTHNLSTDTTFIINDHKSQRSFIFKNNIGIREYGVRSFSKFPEYVMSRLLCDNKNSYLLIATQDKEQIKHLISEEYIVDRRFVVKNVFNNDIDLTLTISNN